MLNNLTAEALVLLSTYWLHSTLLLAAAWLMQRSCPVRSHALRERAWKLAAVLPLVTAPCQWVSGASGITWNLAHEASERIPADIELTDRPLETGQNRTGWQVADASRPSTSPPDWKPEVENQFTPASKETVAASQEPHPARSTAGSGGAPSALRPPASIEPRTAKRRHPVATGAQSPLGIRSTSDPFTEVVQPRDGAPVHAGWPAVLGEAAVLLILLGLIRLFVQSLRFRRLVADAQTIPPGPVSQDVIRLRRRAGLRRPVTVFTSRRFSEPGAFGVVRRRIILPEEIDRKLNRHELQALLAHELGHLIRGDTLWLVIGRVLCGCLPFQPLNLLARRRWQQAAEYRCDDWALQHGADPLGLARCLTRVAEWRLSSRGCPHLLTVGGPKTNLAGRIERLLADRPRQDPWTVGLRRWLVPLTGLACGLALICWGPRTALLADTSVEPHTHGGPLAQPVPHNAESPTTLTEEFRKLDKDMDRLQAELARLKVLLKSVPADRQARKLAERLIHRIAALRLRRRTLQTQFAHRNYKAATGGRGTYRLAVPSLAPLRKESER